MRGRDQVGGAHPGEVALAHLGQRGGVVIVGEHPQVDPAGDDAVLHVMHRIGDIVGPVHHLGFQTGPICGRVFAHPGGGVAVEVVEAELASIRTPRPGIFGDRIQPRPGQVQSHAMPLLIKDFGLQAGQDPEVLRITLEAAVRRGELIERLFPVVAVRRVPDVVGQTGHVDKVGVAAQPDRHPPPDLGDLQRMGQSRARGIAFPRPDDLCLVGKAAQRGAVQNPGAIPGEVGAVLALGARQARGLRRFGNHPLAVEIVIGVLLTHRPTVCQHHLAMPRSGLDYRA